MKFKILKKHNRFILINISDNNRAFLSVGKGDMGYENIKLQYEFQENAEKINQ